MKKWKIKYLIFILILVLGITLYTDKAYAATKQINYINTQMTCTYKLKANRSISGGNNITIIRQLEPANLKDQNSYIYYYIEDYFNSKKLSKIETYGGNNDMYYTTHYECPKSFIFYDKNWDMNGKTKIYFSTKLEGSSNWNTSKSYAIYALDAQVISNDAIEAIPKDESCSYTMQNKSDVSYNVYTTLYNETSEYQGKHILYKLYFNYFGYTQGGFNETGSQWTIRNRADYLFESPEIVQKVKAAFATGNCESDYMKYAYYNAKKEGLAFSNQADLVATKGANDFDGSDEDYALFINNLIYKKSTENIDNAVSEFDAIYKNYTKYCTEGSSDYDEEKCKTARDNFNEASSKVQAACTEANLVVGGEEFRKKCSESLKIAANNGYTGFDHGSEINCTTIAGVVELLQNYFNVIKFLVPILVIGLGILDFIKAMAASDDDALKKAGNKFAKRIIIGVIIILLPIFINIILQLVTKYSLSTCGIK